MRDVQGSVYADLIGKPFLWRGRGEGGLDCFGLVLEMFKRTGQVLPQLNTPSNLAAVSAMAAVQFANPDWQPCERAAGSMVVFGMPITLGGRRVIATTHCGFMLSTSEFIHSWEDTGGITVERAADWERRIAGFYTFRQEK